MTSEIKKMYKRLSGARRHAEHCKVFTLLCRYYPTQHGAISSRALEIGWVDEQWVLLCHKKVVAYGTLDYIESLMTKNISINEENQPLMRKTFGALSTVAP